MVLADLEALALAGAYVAGATLAFQGNRTMLHVATGNVAWFAFLFTDPRFALAGALLLFAGALYATVRPPRLYREVLAGDRDFGPAMFFLGFAVVAAVWAAAPGWPPGLVVMVMMPMAFADPVGLYVGQKWGRHRLRNTKSWEGFAAVLAASLLVTATLGAMALGGGFAALTLAPFVAIGAALGETLAPRHMDNLLMPVGALVGVGLWLILSF